jgi:endoglucanase
MNAEGKKFLEDILHTPAPTGDEFPLQRKLRDWARGFADRVEPDIHGNLTVVINPDAPLKVLLPAHCDRIGFMIVEIDQDGYLRIDKLGGIDEQVMVGQRVVVHAGGGPVPGVIGKTATHEQSKDARDKTPKVDDVWIDIGARGREEARKRVAIGDYATYRPAMDSFRGPEDEEGQERIAAPGLDNAVGVWAVMETARRCAKEGVNVALYCVSTVQEEIGSRGAETAVKTINPQVAIAMDTTIALDDPSTPDRKHHPKIKLDAGPTVSRGPNTSCTVAHKLVDAANHCGIKHQLEAHADLESNDAKPLQVAGGPAAAASVGIPIRNMHTPVEVASLKDVEWTAQMLTQFVLALKGDETFHPIDYDQTRKTTYWRQEQEGNTATTTANRVEPRDQGDRRTQAPVGRSAGQSNGQNDGQPAAGRNTGSGRSDAHRDQRESEGKSKGQSNGKTDSRTSGRSSGQSNGRPSAQPGGNGQKDRGRAGKGGR